MVARWNPSSRQTNQNPPLWNAVFPGLFFIFSLGFISSLSSLIYLQLISKLCFIPYFISNLCLSLLFNLSLVLSLICFIHLLCFISFYFISHIALISPLSRVHLSSLLSSVSSPSSTLSHLYPLTSLLYLYLCISSLLSHLCPSISLFCFTALSSSPSPPAGSCLCGGRRERGGPEVPDDFSGDSRRREWRLSMCLCESLYPGLPECGFRCKPARVLLVWIPLCLPGDGGHSQRAEEPAQQSCFQA